MRAVRLVTITLAAAVTGSAVGTALLLVPGALLEGNADDRAFAAGIVFALSLPFTLLCTILLTVASHLLRDSLGRDWLDYGGIVLAAMLVGALMPLPLFGALGLFFGALFALLTAGTWAALYRAFALPSDLRDFQNG